MRCSTRSGSYQCDLHEGHDGECETRQEGQSWVGPAYGSPQLTEVARLAERTNDARLKELRKQLAQAQRMAGLPQITSPLKS